MKARFYATLLILLGISVSANAAFVAGTWSTSNSLQATGQVGGVQVTATTTASAPFRGFNSGRFAGQYWNTGDPLTEDVEGLNTHFVGPNDQQTFTFSSPLVDNAKLYIENFDSSSRAVVTALGATSISLLDANSGISYQSTGANSGILSTTNPTFDGLGDLVLSFTGPVDQINLAYSQGTGNNGVFYAFAVPEDGVVSPPTNPPSGGGGGGDPNAVPEPTSLLVMAGLFAITGVMHRRRKQK